MVKSIIVSPVGTAILAWVSKRWNPAWCLGSALQEPVWWLAFLLRPVALSVRVSRCPEQKTAACFPPQPSRALRTRDDSEPPIPGDSIGSKTPDGSPFLFKYKLFIPYHWRAWRFTLIVPSVIVDAGLKMPLELCLDNVELAWLLLRLAVPDSLDWLNWPESGLEKTCSFDVGVCGIDLPASVSSLGFEEFAPFTPLLPPFIPLTDLLVVGPLSGVRLLGDELSAGRLLLSLLFGLLVPGWGLSSFWLFWSVLIEPKDEKLIKFRLSLWMRNKNVLS